MYEERFGTDEPVDLSLEELLTRAYALGVVTQQQTRRSGELDRLLAAATDAYERTLVQLSFDEGQGAAQAVEDDPGETEEPWAVLLEGRDPDPEELLRDEDDGEQEGDDDSDSGVFGPPAAVSQLLGEEFPDGEIEATKRPDMFEY